MPPVKRSKYRLPVQQHMTESMMARMPKLRTKLTRSLWSHVGATMREKDASYAKAMLPKPHNILVTITGRILSEEQIRMGAYIPAQELDLARRALSATSLAQPSFEEMMRAASDAAALSQTGSRPPTQGWDGGVTGGLSVASASAALTNTGRSTTR